jgi:riboflavin kinase/FMN adenylyltransferase
VRVLRGDYRQWRLDLPATAVTIGVYDGVHRGHRAVLESLVHRTDGYPVAVVSFADHPLRVLDPERAPGLITTLEQRLEELADAGVAVTALLDFDEIMRATSAEDFVRHVLVDGLHARLVAVGSDFRFGHQRLGDVDLLRRMGGELGFDVLALDLAQADGVPVSSTQIRRLIVAGDMEAAGDLLGRRFSLRGRVVAGDGRGGAIGYHTANLELAPTQVLPARGVYAAWVRTPQDTHPAVVNVGVRPTFGGHEQVVEAHLLDFDGDLYSDTIEIGFITHLRDEQRFADVDELAAQIGRDVAAARDVLSRSHLDRPAGEGPGDDTSGEVVHVLESGLRDEGLDDAG